MQSEKAIRKCNQKMQSENAIRKCKEGLEVWHRGDALVHSRPPEPSSGSLGGTGTRGGARKGLCWEGFVLTQELQTENAGRVL
jgi:hypothetical protein